VAGRSVLRGADMQFGGRWLISMLAAPSVAGRVRAAAPVQGEPRRGKKQLSCQAGATAAGQAAR